MRAAMPLASTCPALYSSLPSKPASSASGRSPPARSSSASSLGSGGGGAAWWSGPSAGAGEVQPSHGGLEQERALRAAARWKAGPAPVDVLVDAARDEAHVLGAPRHADDRQLHPLRARTQAARAAQQPAGVSARRAGARPPRRRAAVPPARTLYCSGCGQRSRPMTVLLPLTDWSGSSLVVTGPWARGMTSGCRPFLSEGETSLLPWCSSTCAAAGGAAAGGDHRPAPAAGTRRRRGGASACRRGRRAAAAPAPQEAAGAAAGCAP
jgi:hypothetical protein